MGAIKVGVIITSRRVDIMRGYECKHYQILLELLSLLFCHVLKNVCKLIFRM